jgi:hypothetical protein
MQNQSKKENAETYGHPNLMPMPVMQQNIDVLFDGFRRMTLDNFRTQFEHNRAPIGGFHSSINKADQTEHNMIVRRHQVPDWFAVYSRPVKLRTQANLMNVMADNLEKIAATLRMRCLPWQASFLSNMMADDSGSTHVMSSFLTLHELWLMSKTSYDNAHSLVPSIHKKMLHTMRKGATMFCYFDYYWKLAYVACVINSKTDPSRYAYHMTIVGTTITTTIFDYNVAEYTSTSASEPTHTPAYRAIHYGNPGSLTSRKPHDLCIDGFHAVCGPIPDDFKSTAPRTCCMPAAASTNHITTANIGTLVDLNSMCMIPQHANAIAMLEARRPDFPVNFHQGYSETALQAIAHHHEVHEYHQSIGSRIYQDFSGYGFDYYGRPFPLVDNSMPNSIDALYASMPHITRTYTTECNGIGPYMWDTCQCSVCTIGQATLEQNWVPPSNAWLPGVPNRSVYHHLDDRSGNWVVGGGTSADRRINWNSRGATGDTSSDEEY